MAHWFLSGFQKITRLCWESRLGREMATSHTTYHIPHTTHHSCTPPTPRKVTMASVHSLVRACGHACCNGNLVQHGERNPAVLGAAHTCIAGPDYELWFGSASRADGPSGVARTAIKPSLIYWLCLLAVRYGSCQARTHCCEMEAIHTTSHGIVSDRDTKGSRL